MRRAFLIAIFLIALVTAITLRRPTPPPSTAPASHPAFASILKSLEHECDPANPEGDYGWTQKSPPTEQRREKLIEQCVNIGPALLPDVQAAMKSTTNPELRGMMIVLSAALGDGNAVESAAKEMLWADSPAVRLCAAQTLRRLRDPRTTGWLENALLDDHFVQNGGDCGGQLELFFPVRVTAELALREMKR